MIEISPRNQGLNDNIIKMKGDQSSYCITISFVYYLLEKLLAYALS